MVQSAGFGLEHWLLTGRLCGVLGSCSQLSVAFTGYLAVSMTRKWARNRHYSLIWVPVASGPANLTDRLLLFRCMMASPASSMIRLIFWRCLALLGQSSRSRCRHTFEIIVCDSIGLHIQSNEIPPSKSIIGSLPRTAFRTFQTRQRTHKPPRLVCAIKSSSSQCPAASQDWHP